MNYVLATVLKIGLGLLVPRLFRLEVGRVTGLAIGGASALAAFHVIGFTGIYPKGLPGVALASVPAASRSSSGTSSGRDDRERMRQRRIVTQELGLRTHRACHHEAEFQGAVRAIDGGSLSRSSVN
jgi:hypothetical protein